MYSKAEMQSLKKEFWIAFSDKYPRKWLLYDTKIKDFSFNFDADNRQSQVMLDIEMKNEAKRLAYFEKLEALKSILEEDFIKGLSYERELTLENGKTISRISISMNDAGISNRGSWDRIFDFFHEHMNAFELFYFEFDEYIKDISI